MARRPRRETWSLLRGDRADERTAVKTTPARGQEQSYCGPTQECCALEQRNFINSGRRAYAQEKKVKSSSLMICKLYILGLIAYKGFRSIG